MEYHYLYIINKYLYDRYELILGSLSNYHVKYRLSKLFILKKYITFDYYMRTKLINVKNISLPLTSFFSQIINEHKRTYKNIFTSEFLDKIMKVNKISTRYKLPDNGLYEFCEIYIENMDQKNILSLITCDFDAGNLPNGIKKMIILYESNFFEKKKKRKFNFPKTIKKISINNCYGYELGFIPRTIKSLYIIG